KDIVGNGKGMDNKMTRRYSFQIKKAACYFRNTWLFSFIS
ncbi:MAG: hypothetical protein ACI9LN_001717, partial [Saprospiraceae bacterium]